MSIPGHIHITERESDGTWEDCTFCSALEWYRLVYDLSKPATHAEAEALRKVSGRLMTGGTNYGDVRKAVLARYGVTLPAVQYGIAALKAALKPGMVAAISGSMRVFGPTHRLSRWDPNFDGGHAVLLANIGGTLLWCDPEAPTGADVPVSVTFAEVEKFVNAFNGGFLVGPIKALLPKEDTMRNIITPMLGASFTIKADSNIRVEPVIASTKVRQSKGEVVQGGVGTVRGDADPGNHGNTIWYAWLEGGAWRFTAADNVTKVTPAATSADDGFTKATQDAAVLAQKTADDAAQKTAVESAKASAVATERSRIRGILGI